MAKEATKKQDAKPEKKPSKNELKFAKTGKEVNEKRAKNTKTVMNPVKLTNKEKIELEKHFKKIKLSGEKKELIQFDGLFEGYSFINKEITVSGRQVIILSVIKNKTVKEESDDEDDDGQPKAPSATEVKSIEKEIKAALKLMLTLPPPAFVKITPGLLIDKLNASGICTYTIDKLIRIALIPVFATGSLPTLAQVQLVYDNLLPLAGVKTNTLNTSDKFNKKTWTKQLKDMMGAMATSCAGLANGNMALFLLSGFRVRKTAVSFNSQLAACVFRITTNHGGNTLGVNCDPIDYAKNYTIYYSNLLPFSMATAIQQTGPSSQLLEDLTGGDMMTIIMIANGKKLKGKVANPQTRRVPFD